MHDIGHKGGLMVTPQGALHPGGHIKSHALRIFFASNNKFADFASGLPS